MPGTAEPASIAAPRARAARISRQPISQGTGSRPRRLRGRRPAQRRRAAPRPHADPRMPAPSAPRSCCCGERFTVYETSEDGDLAWGQAELDGYVGYVAAGGLGPLRPHGQRITALWSHSLSPSRRPPPPPPRPTCPSWPKCRSPGPPAGFARLRGGGHVPPHPYRPGERATIVDAGDAVSRHPLPLGRAQRARPRLLGARPARRSSPAAPAPRATPTCRRRACSGRTLAAGGAARRAAISSSGSGHVAIVADRPDPAPRQRATTWPSRANPSPPRSRASRRRTVPLTARRRP